MQSCNAPQAQLAWTMQANSAHSRKREVISDLHGASARWKPRPHCSSILQFIHSGHKLRLQTYVCSPTMQPERKLVQTVQANSARSRERSNAGSTRRIRTMETAPTLLRGNSYNRDINSISRYIYAIL